MQKGFAVQKVPVYGWGLIVATGLIWLGFGIVFFIPLDTVFLNGPPSAYSPQALSDVTNASRLLAVVLMQGGLLLLALGLKPFKEGMRWAWYSISTVPVMGILGAYIVYLGNGTVISTIIIFSVLPLLGLLLSVRGFFPARPKGGATESTGTP